MAPQGARGVSSAAPGQDALLQSQAAHTCPRAAAMLVSDLQVESSAAAAASDLQEKAIYDAQKVLSIDESVENLFLLALQPGMAPGVVKRAEEDQEQQKKEGAAHARARAAAAASLWGARRVRETERGSASEGQRQTERDKSQHVLGAEGEAALQRHDPHRRMVLDASSGGRDRQTLLESEVWARRQPFTDAVVDERLRKKEESAAENLITRLELKVGERDEGTDQGWSDLLDIKERKVRGCDTGARRGEESTRPQPHFHHENVAYRTAKVRLVSFLRRQVVVCVLLCFLFPACGSASVEHVNILGGPRLSLRGDSFTLFPW